MLSISLPRIFEEKGSGYPLRVYKITLKWTGHDKILTKDQLGSNLVHKKRTKYKKNSSEIIT